MACETTAPRSPDGDSGLAPWIRDAYGVGMIRCTACSVASGRVIAVSPDTKPNLIYARDILAGCYFGVKMNTSDVKCREERERDGYEETENKGAKK
jgi:hypothetical protein